MLLHPHRPRGSPCPTRSFTRSSSRAAPCSKNRLVKSAMSDSLVTDGATPPVRRSGLRALGRGRRRRLHRRRGPGRSAVRREAGQPGGSDPTRTRSGSKRLPRAARRTVPGCGLQLGHAGAMTHPPIGMPKGPSALSLPGLEECEALKPRRGARAAGGVRPDGELRAGARLRRRAGARRARLPAEPVPVAALQPTDRRLRGDRSPRACGCCSRRWRAVRGATGSGFVVAVKLNATDQLEGGFEESEALETIAALDATGIDLNDISGGTYFPGRRVGVRPRGLGPLLRRLRPSRATSHGRASHGHRWVQDAAARRARACRRRPGPHRLARALALEPALPNAWRAGAQDGPDFPRFADPPEGAVTAWYTQRLTALGEDRESDAIVDARTALHEYEARDAGRVALWNGRHGA